MRKIFISELDPNAHALARRTDAGIETIAFCTAENMEDTALIDQKRAELQPFGECSLHAPYFELTPCAIDSRIGEVSRLRYRQAVETCLSLGIRRMVVHSGFLPMVYYPEWFVPKSVDFWRDFVRDLPDGFMLLLENVLDTHADCLARICDAVNDPHLKLCLDIGHANVYSRQSAEEWIETLGARVAHIHIHNNDGTADRHCAPEDGTMDMRRIMRLLDRHAPEAALCIESTETEKWLEWLGMI